MRVGTIVTLLEEKKFGFIRTEHFRDDVFFHQSTLQGIQFRQLEVGMEVEFEINEILRLDEQKLEATVVQFATRPLSKSLAQRPMRELLAAHHPRARQRKPSWREKKDGTPDTELGQNPEATQSED
jgi:cold shock CspA family protein